MLDFRVCKDDDFTKRGLDEKKIVSFGGDGRYMKLCPDFETYPELTKVRHDYNNPERDDLAILITKCDNSDLPKG